MTLLAPPHWEFLTTDPPLEQEDFCLQVDLSGISKWNSSSQSNSTETSNSVTEKSLTDGDEPQPKLGELDLSWEALPVMHLSWNVRPVRTSRFLPEPNEPAHCQPENEKSP